MEAIDFHSESAGEDTGRMSGIVFLAGQVVAGGLGAAVGVLFAGIGFRRRERWRTFRSKHKFFLANSANLVRVDQSLQGLLFLPM